MQNENSLAGLFLLIAAHSWYNKLSNIGLREGRNYASNRL